jgi:hypothetical protein
MGGIGDWATAVTNKTESIIKNEHLTDQKYYNQPNSALAFFMFLCASGSGTNK